MNYKTGDKVRVRNDLKIGVSYNNHGAAPEMLLFCGKVVTVKSKAYNQNTYHIEENDWFWTDEMFEGLVTNQNNPFEISVENAMQKVHADLTGIVEFSKTIIDEKNKKGENMLESLNLVDLYYNNKIEKLKEETEVKIKEIRESSSNAKKLKELVDNFKKAMDKLYISQFDKKEKEAVKNGEIQYEDFDTEIKKTSMFSAGYCIDSVFNTDEIFEIKSNKRKENNKLQEVKKTVKAHVAIAKTKEEVEEILKRYGILTEDGKLAINEDN